jgi:hypothetical protein
LIRVNLNVEPILDKIPLWIRNRYPALLFFIAVTWLELGLFITFRPDLTAYLALLMILMATVTALVFDRNFFCRYVCFVGAIVGLYSNLAPVEVRTVVKSVCRTCGTKDCFRGNERGYGCPTWEFPASMEKNSNCILCTECLKSCPHENLALNARPFFKDVVEAPQKRTDEGVFIAVLGGLTLFHGVTMIPFWMDRVVGMVEQSPLAYAGIFTGVQALFVFGSIGIMWAAARWTASMGNGIPSTGRVFKDLSYALLPVVIMYHLAHNLLHLNEDAATLIPVLSDPFGWGWNLFGTGAWNVHPILNMHGMMLFGAVLTGIGLILGMVLSYRIVRKMYGQGTFLRSLPTWVSYVAFTLFGLFTLLQPMAHKTAMMHH